MNVELNYEQTVTLRSLLTLEVDRLNKVLERPNLDADFEGMITVWRDEKEELLNVFRNSIDEWLGLAKS